MIPREGWSWITNYFTCQC